MKYSQAKTVAVHLGGSTSGLALSVVDDGVGFDIDMMEAKGLGLVSMKERLEVIGGSLEFAPPPARALGSKLPFPFTSSRLVRLPRPDRPHQQSKEVSICPCAPAS